MSKTIRDVMTHELFGLRPQDPTERAAEYLLALGVSGAPVLDDDGTPVGVVSLRDLMAKKSRDRVHERMSTPAIVVRETASVDDASDLLLEHGIHRVVVTDDAGKATGIVSSLDLVGALRGAEREGVSHGGEISASWSDEKPLDIHHVDEAPSAPGVFVLVHGGGRYPKIALWAEAVHDVRQRLRDLLSLPQTDNAELARLLDRYHQSLKFRVAVETGR